MDGLCSKAGRGTCAVLTSFAAPTSRSDRHAGWQSPTPGHTRASVVAFLLLNVHLKTLEIPDQLAVLVTHRVDVDAVIAHGDVQEDLVGVVGELVDDRPDLLFGDVAVALEQRLADQIAVPRMV